MILSPQVKMAEEHVVAVGGAEGANDTHTGTLRPRAVFLVPALDSPQQRQEVVAKIQEFIASESLETCGGVTHVGQVGWEETSQMWSLTSHLMSTCRRHNLLPSERCILLSLHDQYQAIQLCLARINKVKQGEFMAAASDVLDVWKAMYRETVASKTLSEAQHDTEDLEGLNQLTASQESCDPLKKELQEVIKDYRDFLANSVCVDHFGVFECLQGLMKNDPARFREVLSKAYIIEGLEQLPLMERELLKLISDGSQTYRVSVELPFSIAAPPSPSTLNISGIHETSILQTPSRQDKKEEETDYIDDHKDTHEPETHNSNQQTDEKDNNTDNAMSIDTSSSHTKHQTDKTDSMESDTKNTDSQGEAIIQVESEEHTVESINAAPQTPSNRSKHQTDSTESDTKDADSQGKASNAIIQVEKEEKTLEDIIKTTPPQVPKPSERSESEAYLERLFLAHLRLLINTRDELALTLACSMPGREITHQGFTDIRQEAQRKEMPMYQTIVSFILRLRLGGKGYQPEPNNPVLLHAKPLGEFVNAFIRLQNILETQTDSRQGASRVLNGIKTGLEKMKGCLLKRSVIGTVADRLSTALKNLMEAAEGGEGDSESIMPSSLHPSLKHLICLCDVAGGQVYTGGVVDALGGDLLTQLSSSKKTTQTPVRAPSVLNLFRSPEEVLQGKKGEEEEDLETRLKRKMGKTTTAAALPKRYKSDCSWAPVDLSPIHVDKLNHSTSSPIAGPSLKAVGNGTKRPSEDWRDIVASVAQEEECAPETQTSSSPSKSSSLATTKGPREGDDKPKKARTKRSLLKDISNMASKGEETQSKKQKAAEVKKAAPKQKGKKTKPLLQGQRSITSFFKS